VNRSILLRSAVLQTVLVGVLSVALAIPLGNTFFTHWGWIIGPVAWLLCAYATTTILRLARGNTMLGAVLAGLPSVILVIAGLHTLGDVVAIAAFALWCGAFSADAEHAQLGSAA
jgi:hypothetical protein